MLGERCGKVLCPRRGRVAVGPSHLAGTDWNAVVLDAKLDVGTSGCAAGVGVGCSQAAMGAS